MPPSIDIHYRRRRKCNVGAIRCTSAEEMFGQSFEILVRDDRRNVDLRLDGELKAESFYERPCRVDAFRWEPYRGTRKMNNGNQQPFVDRTAQDGAGIKAEEFEFGTNGFAPGDNSAGNLGGTFRTDADVDIDEATDGAPGFAIGKPNLCEWWEYSTDVVGGTGDLDLRLAARAAAKFRSMPLTPSCIACVKDPATRLKTSQSTPGTPPERDPLDVNGDGKVTAIDSLQVINALNAQTLIEPTLIAYETPSSTNDDVDRVFEARNAQLHPATELTDV